VNDLDLLPRVGAEVHQDHGHGVVGLGVEQTIASGGVTARLLLISTFCCWWRQHWRRTTTLALLDKLGELRQETVTSGGRAQPLDPTPSTMGREFDGTTSQLAPRAAIPPGSHRGTRRGPGREERSTHSPTAPSESRATRRTGRPPAARNQTSLNRAAMAPATPDGGHGPVLANAPKAGAHTEVPARCRHDAARVKAWAASCNRN
jgi:hypothetical protein